MTLREQGGRERSMIFSDFRRALTREILLTERLRVKAVLATVLLLIVSLTAFYLVAPEAIERVWRGHFDISLFYATVIPFIIFELSVLRLIGRRLALNRDVPYLRRYLGTLIETSLPTVALAIQINAMGPERALGYAAPLAYFVFIILSTLRLDLTRASILFERNFRRRWMAGSSPTGFTDLPPADGQTTLPSS
jgi:adenylate cyclase